MIERVRLRPHQAIAIDEALTNPKLLGNALGHVSSWSTWLTALRAAYGLPLDQQQREVFRSIAGGRQPPTERTNELWVIAGRRGGKSRISAAIAVHAALLQKHKLAPGEVGYVLVLSQSVLQATVVLDYCLAFIQGSPILQQQLQSFTATEIRLAGNLVISVHPNSYRSVRGRTLICAIFDETSQWRDQDSALPDSECFRAVMPGLLSTHGLLIGISTPYAKRGLLYQKFKDHFGKDGDVLVLRGSSITFNPTLSQAAIDRALADDPEGMVAEYDAEFRTDTSAFLSEADVDRAIDFDRPTELPPRGDLRYFGFADVSGGRHDASALAIGHREGERVIIDVIRAAPSPHDPQVVTAEYAALLKQYHLHHVTGDNFSQEWVVAAFASNNIIYEKAEWPKSKLYLEALPTFARGLISLPDLKPLRRELLLLERRTHVGGKDTVDHGRGGSDDLVNCVAGAIHLAQKRKPGIRIGSYSCGGGRITWRSGTAALPCPLGENSRIVSSSCSRIIKKEDKYDS